MQWRLEFNDTKILKFFAEGKLIYIRYGRKISKQAGGGKGCKGSTVVDKEDFEVE